VRETGSFEFDRLLLVGEPKSMLRGLVEGNCGAKPRDSAAEEFANTLCRACSGVLGLDEDGELWREDCCEGDRAVAISRDVCGAAVEGALAFDGRMGWQGAR
jgi:hypothetical protein